MTTPMANAKRKVACGENLSHNIQRMYQPGSETIPIAVWNTPKAVPFWFFSARSTTNALSVPSTIANKSPKRTKKKITHQIWLTNANHKVTTKNRLYAIRSIVFLPIRSEIIPAGAEISVYIP